MKARQPTICLICLSILWSFHVPYSNADSLHGSWTDELYDVNQQYIDLYIGGLYAESQTADLELSVNVLGLHPANKQIHTKFELFFNTDDNVTTGSTLGLLRGVDKILRVELTGLFPFTTLDGSVAVELYDIATKNSTPLVSGNVRRVQELDDSRKPDISSSLDAWDSIDQHIALSSLNIQANQAPVGVKATDFDTGEFDQAAFVFNFNPKLSPHFGIKSESGQWINTGQPGQKVKLSGKRYSALSPVHIVFDEKEVLATKTQNDGSFSELYVLPNFPSGDHLITAKDENGIFDLMIFKIKAVEKRKIESGTEN